MKEVRLESGPERMNRICVPDASGQGIPSGRGDVSVGSLAISLCFTVQREMIRSPIEEKEIECMAE